MNAGRGVTLRPASYAEQMKPTLLLISLVGLLAALASAAWVDARPDDSDDPNTAMLTAEHEQTLYVEARRLSSGNVQFRLQTSTGPLTPARRTFLASVRHQRWMSSSSVTLEDDSMVRIIARRSGDALLEFGVRIDRSRQEFFPRFRFFPLGSPIGDWIRSSEAVLPAAEAVTAWPTPEDESVERISGGHRDGLIVDGGVLGDPDAPVLIVEYGDPF